MEFRFLKRPIINQQAFMRNFLVIACLLFLPLITTAQESNLYINDWKKADSLFDRGLPQSALKIAASVYQKAKAKNQQVQMLKAQIYLLKADLQTKEEGHVEAIRRSEAEISNTAFPLNAVWQSIAAQLYWNYYQQNRWKIIGRTSVSNSSTIGDFEQWDATRFYNKIAELYTASISRGRELKNIDIAVYDPILTKGVNTRNLRPTLYDLLGFRALAFFENDEKDITKPAFTFTINDAAAFADAATFINHNFKTQDTSSLQWQALGIYQELLSLHLNDAKPDAFIDADLHRLAFVYRSSVDENKNELYIQTLKRIEEKYPGNPLSALAGYRIAETMMGQNPVTPYGYRRTLQVQDTSVDHVAIKKRLERIIARHPKSEGGILASAMLAQLEAKELSIKTEEAVLPGEPSKALVTYRNTPKASRHDADRPFSRRRLNS